MTELQIIKHADQLVIDSRQVAEMMEKRHDHLMRDIKGYIEILEDSPSLGSHDFFLESTYTNSQNKQQPCYLLTKKGCDMVANKMTGEKGVRFTAAYIDKFYEMESRLSQPFVLPQNYVEALEALVVAEKAKQIAQAKVEELTPKANYYDLILQCKTTMPVRQIAKDYGMTSQEFNKLLWSLGIQYKEGNVWYLYAKYDGNGYTQSRTFTTGEYYDNSHYHTYWTQKGRLFLYKLLKERGIVPCIEQTEAVSA